MIPHILILLPVYELDTKSNAVDDFMLILIFTNSSVNACSITRLAITYEVVNDKDVSWKVYKESVWM